MSQLPIDAVLPTLQDRLFDATQVILQAPPGAGKSTRLPLFLLKEGNLPGKIVMLEPRRLAARNIAAYLAAQLGEPVGKQVGYRVRGENKVSTETRLEIVTEGILTRMIQSDPELDGVSLLIFDEYHERSLHADTALALALDVQAGLRDDLKILIMSATLDNAALSGWLPDAAVIVSEGRQFPIHYRHQGIGWQYGWEHDYARAIRKLMMDEPDLRWCSFRGLAKYGVLLTHWKALFLMISSFVSSMVSCPRKSSRLPLLLRRTVTENWF